MPAKNPPYRLFYRDAQEFHSIHDSLKLRPCPHCDRVGHLIFNGCAYGYTDAEEAKSIRHQRVYCSNRGHATGCGHSFGLFPSNRVPGYRVTTAIFWQFARLLLLGHSAYAAFNHLAIALHVRAAYRWCQKMIEAQSAWRTICSRRAPPNRSQPSTKCHHPALASSIQHLTQCFATEHPPDPFAAYQYATGTSIFLDRAA